MHMVCDLLENLGAGVLCSLQNVIRVLYFFLGVWDAMLLVLCWIFGERLREDTFPCSNRVFFYSICINCFKFLRYGVLNSFSMFGDLFVCPLHGVNWLDDV